MGQCKAGRVEIFLTGFALNTARTLAVAIDLDQSNTSVFTRLCLCKDY